MSLAAFISTSVLSNRALFALLVVTAIVRFVPLILARRVSPHSKRVEVEYRPESERREKRIQKLTLDSFEFKLNGLGIRKYDY
jgi:hypothetical protein